MVILSIIKKQLIHLVRNPSSNVLMVIYPIVLIVILGFALSGVFDSKIKIEGVKVLYTVDSQANEEAFAGFQKSTANMGIAWEKTLDADAAKASLSSAKITAFIQIAGDPMHISIYKNNKYNFEAGFVTSMIDGFLLRYGTVGTIIKETGRIPDDVMNTAENSRKESGVDIQTRDSAPGPSAIDYFAVSILTMILLYSSMTGSWAIKREQVFKTGPRMLVAPIRRPQMLVGIIVGSIVVTLLQATVVILFSKFILHANWGGDIAAMAVLIFSEAIMAVSMGAGIAMLVKNTELMRTVLNIIAIIFSFLGGAYVPLSSFGSLGNVFSAISPVGWVNRAALDVIYGKNTDLVLPAVAVCLGIAVFFIIIAALKKESLR